MTELSANSDLIFDAFQSPALFVKEQHKSFSTGVLVSGTMNKSHLSDYRIYLKVEYITSSEVRKYKEIRIIAYVGKILIF